MELCNFTPKLNSLLTQENISRSDLAKSLGMSTTMLNRMLNNEKQIWPWVTLSKVLWILGYKVEGLRLSKLK